MQKVKQDIKELWKHNPSNAYSYTTWLYASKYELANSTDELAKQNLLAEMCSVIDRVRSENKEVANDKYFYTIADQIYRLANSEIADEYFDQLIENGSYAGIYIRAHQMLNSVGIEGLSCALSNEKDTCGNQLAMCQKIVDELLDNPSYFHITKLSAECQYMLLRIKWLIYNQEPVFHRYAQYSYMDGDQWREIQGICINYKELFIDTMEVEDYVSNSVLYLLALSYAQLSEYSDCLALVRELRTRSEWLYQVDRIRTKHILCDSEGAPLIFTGTLPHDFDEYAVSGNIEIYELQQYLPRGRNGVHYASRNIKKLHAEPGEVIREFQLGLGYMGFSVYYGLRGAKNG